MAENDPKQGEGGAAGTPNLEEANKRLTSENAALKAEKEALSQQLADEKAAKEGLEKQLKDALTDEDVSAAVQKALADAKAESDAQAQAWKEREKRLTVENALIAAGCVDAAAAMAHVDLGKVEVASDGHVSGLDAKALAESRPYLFASAQGGTSSAWEPGGGADKAMTRKEIAEIKDPQERREALGKLVEANKD